MGPSKVRKYGHLGQLGAGNGGVQVIGKVDLGQLVQKVTFYMGNGPINCKLWACHHHSPQE